MTDVAKNVIDKIKAEGIEPKSKWYFIIANTTFWIIFLIALILGANSFAFMLHVLLDGDIQAAWQMDHLWEVFRIFPFLWVVTFALFIALAYVGLHHTKSGYKMSVPVLVSANMVAVIVIGTGGFLLHIPEQVEPHLKGLPLVRTLEMRKKDLWTQPERGLLGGNVIEVQPPEAFALIDFQGKTWTVQVIRPIPLPKEDTLIRMKGRATGNDTFEAVIIAPMNPRPPQKAPIPVPTP